MKSLTLTLVTIALSVAACIAGPKVTVNERTNSVRIFDAEFEMVRELKAPDEIKTIQGIFLRAEEIGNSKSHIKTPTHKIDFSDRWLVDMNNGELSVLSKAVRPVYRIAPDDLETLKKVIGAKS